MNPQNQRRLKRFDCCATSAISSARMGACRGRHQQTGPGCTRPKKIVQVQGLQEQLARVSDQPLLGLQEAAGLLADHLGVDLVA
jgi:hypothetical protein